MLAKTPELRCNLLQTSFIAELLRVCVSTWISEETSSEPATPLLNLILHCLLRIAKVFARRGVIITTSEQAQAERSAFLSQGIIGKVSFSESLGGILTIWLLLKKTDNSELRTFIYKNLFDRLAMEDLEQQLRLLAALDKELKEAEHMMAKSKSGEGDHVSRKILI